MVLAGNIKRTRRLRGLSQNDLAVRIGTQPSDVSRWETARHRPRDATLVAIAEALDTTVEALLTDSGDAA